MQYLLANAKLNKIMVLDNIGDLAFELGWRVIDQDKCISEEKISYCLNYGYEWDEDGINFDLVDFYTHVNKDRPTLFGNSLGD